MRDIEKLEQLNSKFVGGLLRLKKSVLEDPANIWTREDQDELDKIKGLTERIEHILRKIFSRTKLRESLPILDKELEEFLRLIKHPQANKHWIENIHHFLENWTYQFHELVALGRREHGIGYFFEEFEKKYANRIFDEAVEEYKKENLQGEPLLKLKLLTKIFAEKFYQRAVQKIKRKNRAWFKGPVKYIDAKFRDPLCQMETRKAMHVLLVSYGGVRDLPGSESNFPFTYVYKRWIDEFQQLIKPYDTSEIEKLIQKVHDEHKKDYFPYSLMQIFGLIIEFSTYSKPKSRNKIRRTIYNLKSRTFVPICSDDLPLHQKPQLEKVIIDLLKQLEKMVEDIQIKK